MTSDCLCRFGLDGMLAMASNAMVTKPKNIPRKTPAKNIAKAMAVTPYLLISGLTNADGPGNQAGETVTFSLFICSYCDH
jgi:hypothetical protein